MSDEPGAVSRGVDSMVAYQVLFASMLQSAVRQMMMMIITSFPLH